MKSRSDDGFRGFMLSRTGIALSVFPVVSGYFLCGWLQANYPDIDWLTYDAGHIPEMLFGWKANPHFGPFHLLSFVFIGGRFILISSAWRVLYQAQRTGTLATSGPYARIRHPQYMGFASVMIGFLF